MNSGINIRLKSGLIKRSVKIHGHSTSIALEAEFWAVIDKIAREQNISLAKFITQIDDERTKTNSPNNLASTLRLTALIWALGKISPPHHQSGPAGGGGLGL